MANYDELLKIFDTEWEAEKTKLQRERDMAMQFMERSLQSKGMVKTGLYGEQMGDIQSRMQEAMDILGVEHAKKRYEVRKEEELEKRARRGATGSLIGGLLGTAASFIPGLNILAPALPAIGSGIGQWIAGEPGGAPADIASGAGAIQTAKAQEEWKKYLKSLMIGQLGELPRLTGENYIAGMPGGFSLNPKKNWWE